MVSVGIPLTCMICVREHGPVTVLVAVSLRTRPFAGIRATPLIWMARLSKRSGTYLGRSSKLVMRV